MREEVIKIISYLLYVVGNICLSAGISFSFKRFFKNRIDKKINEIHNDKDIKDLTKSVNELRNEIQEMRGKR